MQSATPKIDRRTFKELLRQAQALAPFYTPEWVPGQPGDPGQALLNIFLHLQEQVLARLNRVPDKNLVVFLDMLGVKLLPAQSAQAGVSFTLATGTTEHVLVPRGTLLAGDAADGSGQVVFQTQRDRLVTPAALRQIFSFDVPRDSIYSHTPEGDRPQPFTVFGGKNRQEHSLYLGHADLLNQKKPTTIEVDFLLAGPAADGSDLDMVWEYFDGTRWAEITRFVRDAQTGALDDRDGTRLFTKSGTVKLVKGQTAEIAETEVGGVKNRWVRCRLIKKLRGDKPVQLPSIDTVRLSVSPTDPFPPDLAFNNDVPLNLSETRVKMLAKGTRFRFADRSPDPARRTVIRLRGHAGALTRGDFLSLDNRLDPVEIREVEAVAGAEVTLRQPLRFDYETTSEVSLYTALRPRTNLGPEEVRVQVESLEDLQPHKGSRATLFRREHREGAVITLAEADAKASPPKNTLTLTRDAAPSKPFYVEGDFVEITPRLNPFGKLPLAFDTFYLASDEAFSKKGARVTLKLNAGWKDFTPGTKPEPDPVLSWEYWNGRSWRGLRVTDTTDRFKKDGLIIFECPDDIEKVEVNGEEKFWVRVRIIDGDYGREIVLNPLGGNRVDITKGTVHYPVISNLLISYENVGEQPQKCLTRNSLNLEDRTEESRDPNRTFAPFAALTESFSGLALGFDKALKGGPLSLLFDVKEQFLGQDERVKVLWSYWNGRAWSPINVSDETESLTRIGLLEFLVGRDFSALRMFGEELFWLKASFVEGAYPEPPRINGLYPNTTYALQADVANNELVGSGNGTGGQEFALQHPLVISQQVFVREPVLPTEEEQEAIRGEEGPDAITVRTNELGETVDLLVRWHEVDDFDLSGPQSRHYTIDRRLGTLKFGDGTRGMAPPVGADNVVVSYTFGGGRKGNVPAGAVSGLKSAVPFVNAVTNHLAADGGAEPETLEDVLTRGPLLLKNRNRAVTPEDFEALARGASRKVARAKCLPNTDEERNEAPGWVTVMIVPEGKGAAPRPSQQLIRVVREGLETHSANVVSAPGHIHVTGPDYVEVTVEVEVVPAALDRAAAVETALRAKLNRYIHPLTGGPDGAGWEFGRDICLSEIIALAEGVEDVDHVERLSLRADGRASAGDVKLGRYALPVSGEHIIGLALDGAQGAPDPCRASKTECAPRQEYTPYVKKKGATTKSGEVPEGPETGEAV